MALKIAALRCAELTPELLEDYLAFFDRRAFTDNRRWAGCYCYFPLHDPAKTGWQQRTADENRAAVTRGIMERQARGYLAYAGDIPVGWCNAGPWRQFPMLHEYKEVNTETLGFIFCFVVAPEARGRGVATALLAAACAGLRRQGMTAVQAKPRREAQGAAANHLGPLSMYLKAGFEVIRQTAEGDVIVGKLLAGPE